MFTIRSIAIVPLLIGGCLPPPHAWPDQETGAGGGAQDSASPDSGDSAAPTMECSSVVFDEDGHVSIQASDLESGSFYTNGDFTIEFWAWFSDVDLSVSRTLVSLGPDGAWWIGTGTGDLVFRVEDAEIRGTAPTSGWHHVAVVKDESVEEIRMYLDGSLFDEVMPFEGAFPSPEEDALHLARAHGFPLSWVSSMDEIRFSDRVNYEGATVTILDALDTEPWLGVWHFDEDLSNALNGSRASGTGYSIVDSCPPYSL